MLNGQRLNLEEHPTDFSVIGYCEALRRAQEDGDVLTEPLSSCIVRCRVTNPNHRDPLMESVRRERVAHHIYVVPETGEEIVIDDRIIVEFRREDPEEVMRIIEEFCLEPQECIGGACIFKVTDATGCNPVKVANAINERETVVECCPQILVPVEMHETSLAETYRLFRHQWYLSADQIDHPDLDPTADICAPEAWECTRGDPEVVVAVIDDGFDLDHPVFRSTRIHAAARDFAVMPHDWDPRPEARNYHGTCVASLAVGSCASDDMLGVAPECTFLPVRIGFGPFAPIVELVQVFQYCSKYADVCNCSFGIPPASFDPIPRPLRQEIAAMCRFGGRRGQGLVMIFSAGNNDAPTYLRGEQNRNGVKFVRFRFGKPEIVEIPKGRDVFCGFAMISGAIVVGSTSSMCRKAGYSNWGRHLTCCAPSSNMHHIARFIPKGVNDQVRDQFVTNYRGLGQVAAVNRAGRGLAFDPMLDDPTTDLRENFYTKSFGGTSGAAPLVCGVAALMLSINRQLSARQVRLIIEATADRDLDLDLDLAGDPNLQGFTGEFVRGRSPFFGAGKVNCGKAVRRAAALTAATMPVETRAFGPPAPMVGIDTTGLTSIQNLRFQTMACSLGTPCGRSAKRWLLAPPTDWMLMSFPSRLWAVGQNGTYLHEYRQVEMPSNVEELPPGTFCIRLNHQLGFVPAPVPAVPGFVAPPQGFVTPPGGYVAPMGQATPTAGFFTGSMPGPAGFTPTPPGVAAATPGFIELVVREPEPATTTPQWLVLASMPPTSFTGTCPPQVFMANGQRIAGWTEPKPVTRAAKVPANARPLPS